KNNGMIGNIYSMGLALQALESSSEFYAPRKWNSAQACNVVYNHDYQQPMAIAQVLPALVGKSYLDTGRLCCAVTSGPRAIGCPSPVTVQFSITNTLKNYFHYSTSVCVPDNSTLLQVMEVAAEEKPDIFCFQTIPSNIGPYVTSIHGLAGNTTERTYWQFFSSWSPLQKGGYPGGVWGTGGCAWGSPCPSLTYPSAAGVGIYKPKNWELIQAIFSTY
ncbi:TCO1 protein, partial [Origma solitaria]|nr:TCO1 protein [Origma solitaria]